MRNARLHLCLCWILLSFCVSAHASWRIIQPKVLGFTADGNTFVYIERNDQTTKPDYAIGAVRLDVLTHKEQKHGFERFNDEPDPERLAFQTWLKKNPAKCVGGPRSPDGKYSLKILLKGTVRGRWAQQAYAFDAVEDGSDGRVVWAKVRVLLEYQRKTIQIEKWGLRAEGELRAGLIPCWSPDGQRLALVWYREGAGMRDEGEMSVQMVALSSDLSWEFPPLRP